MDSNQDWAKLSKLLGELTGEMVERTALILPDGLINLPDNYGAYTGDNLSTATKPRVYTSKYLPGDVGYLVKYEPFLSRPKLTVDWEIEPNKDALDAFAINARAMFGKSVWEASWASPGVFTTSSPDPVLWVDETAVTEIYQFTPRQAQLTLAIALILITLVVGLLT